LIEFIVIGIFPFPQRATPEGAIRTYVPPHFAT
jgi:hypothetical protein